MTRFPFYTAFKWAYIAALHRQDPLFFREKYYGPGSLAADMDFHDFIHMYIAGGEL